MTLCLASLIRPATCALSPHNGEDDALVARVDEFLPTTAMRGFSQGGSCRNPNCGPHACFYRGVMLT